MSSDLIRLDAATLGAKIAAKEVSSTEATQASLDQIAATDDRYHAFLHVAEEKALAEAARVDKAIAAGETLPSPLADVPLALKDVNVFRSDEVEPCLTQEEALAEAPKAADGRFAVPRILGEAE